MLKMSNTGFKRDTWTFVCPKIAYPFGHFFQDKIKEDIPAIVIRKKCPKLNLTWQFPLRIQLRLETP